MSKLFVRTLLSGITGATVFTALIFISAGTLNYWQGWLYVAVTIVSLTVYTTIIGIRDPALIQRRLKVGPSNEQRPTQKLITLLLPLVLAFYALPVVDHRYGLSSVPWYANLIGDVLAAFGLYIYYLVLRVNSFAAGTVRVEEGQKVISTGPYAVVRHPMYAGALIYMLGTPPALGSWWSLVFTPFLFLVFVFRIRDEERVLERDLTGYKEYERKVPWRLVPGIF